jgi:hypothetical protein
VARAKPLLAVLIVALAAAGVALADDPTVKINPADQAKATAQLLKKSDLGQGWTGGPRKPDKLQAPSCPGFNPKESDLVVTGHADATFKHQGLELDDDVQVMEKAEFVRTDFARTMKPQLPACLAHLFQQSAGQGVKLLSAKRLAFPRVGVVSALYRVTTAVTSGGQTVNVLLDFVFFGQSRTEYSLTVVAPEAAKAALVPFETRLAKLLVVRTRA